jgi:dephospho-CoA kinase
MADFVIDNSKDRENTYNQVKTIIYRVSIGIEKENK